LKTPKNLKNNKKRGTVNLSSSEILNLKGGRLLRIGEVKFAFDNIWKQPTSPAEAEAGGKG